jgi:hypothetical protein
MDRRVTLTANERDVLARIKARLAERGLKVSEEKFITALLKAASQLAEEDLIRLISEGLQGDQKDEDREG